MHSIWYNYNELYYVLCSEGTHLSLPNSFLKLPPTRQKNSFPRRHNIEEF